MEEIRQLEADMALLQDIDDGRQRQQVRSSPVECGLDKQGAVRAGMEFAGALVPGYLGTGVKSPMPTKQEFAFSDEANQQRGAARRAKAKFAAPGPIGPRVTDSAQPAERGTPPQMPAMPMGGLTPAMAAHLMAYSSLERMFGSPGMHSPATSMTAPSSSPNSTAAAAAASFCRPMGGFGMLGSNTIGGFNDSAFQSFNDSPAYVTRMASGFVAETGVPDICRSPFGAPLRSARRAESDRPEDLGVDLCAQFEQMLASEAAAERQAAEDVLSSCMPPMPPASCMSDAWGPQLQDGGGFEVDQQDDMWQVKNTFLALRPQVKPIRSVRTAEGALCSLGVERQP